MRRKSEFAGIGSEAGRIARLREVLEREAGIEGRPTLAKCKAARERIELRREVAELLDGGSGDGDADGGSGSGSGSGDGGSGDEAGEGRAGGGAMDEDVRVTAPKRRRIDLSALGDPDSD